MLTSRQKEAHYSRLIGQLGELLQKSPSLQAQFATINAILYHKIPYIFWVGFYLLHDHRLIVGPYQGPLACQELEHPHGACWHAILNRNSLIIPDVNLFQDHIACDPRSKSELVIPFCSSDSRVYGVIDLDSDQSHAFCDIDEKAISKILSLIDFKLI
jgi:L-methionine (R)-S-oxide reductase